MDTTRSCHAEASVELLLAPEVAWDVVTLDEAQSIKVADAQRARRARSLPGRHRIALSGTPLENRLEELWSLFEFVVPGLLGGRAQVRRDVAMPIERFNDTAAADRLKKTLSPFLLRRRKADPGVADEGKFLEILKKQPDGSWKYLVDMYSSNLAPQH